MATLTLDRGPQRLDALRHANEARMAAAEVKGELKAGQLTLGEALEDPRAGSARIGELLCAQVRWGPVKVRRALAIAKMHDCFVSEMKRVRDMTPRQRQIVACVAVDIR